VTAALDPRTPVIVGVGQVNRAGTEAPEPVDLLAEAAARAGADSGAERLLAAADSIRVVRLLSWGYRDPGALVADRIGAHPRHTSYSTDGGHTPQVMVNRAASDIQAGRADVILVGGAESWRTRMAYQSRGERPAWTRQPDDTAPAAVEGADLDMVNEIERDVGVFMPVQVYPMFESALRYRDGRSLEDHAHHLGMLWSGFSRVAANNPHAVLPTPMTAEQIAIPAPSNRMIGFPYTKLMNSNNSVNQAAALLLCSLERARAFGIGDDRLVFPHSGSEANDTQYVSNRGDLASSPAIRAGGRAALEAASVGIDDLAHIDLYSCFPSAVQVATVELGIGLDRQVTVTGGLTFAGGPWNNYVTHSIATMADVLRRDPGALGMCSANGGLLTKHSFGVYSTRPPADGFRVVRPDVGSWAPVREVLDGRVTGPAVIEAYTVMHDGQGRPEVAILTALLPDGNRAWRTSHEPELLAQMTREEFCGRPLELAPGGELAVV
jgi:acetyl-CoA C-acetyltransferase